MPRPVDLEPHIRHDGIHEDAWETWPAFFDTFRRDRALVDWVEVHGRRTFTTYTLERSPDLARRFASDVPELLVPAASSLGYAWPEPILPDPVAAVVAPQAGDGTISPVPILLVGCIADGGDPASPAPQPAARGSRRGRLGRVDPRPVPHVARVTGGAHPPRGPVHGRAPGRGGAGAAGRPRSCSRAVPSARWRPGPTP